MCGACVRVCVSFRSRTCASDTDAVYSSNWRSNRLAPQAFFLPPPSHKPGGTAPPSVARPGAVGAGGGAGGRKLRLSGGSPLPQQILSECELCCTSLGAGKPIFLSSPKPNRIKPWDLALPEKFPSQTLHCGLGKGLPRSGLTQTAHRPGPRGP